MNRAEIKKATERAKQSVDFCTTRMKGNVCQECNMLEALIAADAMIDELQKELYGYKAGAQAEADRGDRLAAELKRVQGDGRQGE